MAAKQVAVAERTIPHSLEAERAVLGAILVAREAIDDVGGLRPGDFYRDAHRRIFEKMRRLADKRIDIDLVTLKDALAKAGELDECGGPAYLAALTDGVPRSTNVEGYARIVREKADLREVIFAANRMLADAYAAEDDASAVIDKAEQSIYAIARRETQGGLVRIGDALPRALDQIDAWHKARGAITGLPSGLRELDRLTLGFQPSKLVIVGARPGLGKSSLVQNILAHVTKGGERVGAMFSMEMDLIELTIRGLATEAQMNSRRMKQGRLSDVDWRYLTQAITALGDCQFYIDDSPYLNLMDIRGRSRRLKAKQGLDLIVVDYTQLMTSHEKRETRTLELAAITRGLKALAKELHVPVIALSQLSRDQDKGHRPRRPRLSDLRESGSFEQDADVVILIHREEDDDGHPKEPGVLELIVAKHRGGPTGTAKVGWRGEETRFFDLPTEAEDSQLPMGER